ncbi:hypothetical protein C8R44DRAFT_774673 [Mycena epipterygia]|nr:hypothetical protein C8R44DRAFT_774673 [Mycena epipterygia]
MSTNQQSQNVLMTSPVFRYAVLIVLCVVVVLSAGVCYRTRAYRRRGVGTGFGGPQPTSSAAHDWGPKPSLFDVYLDPPSEKRESSWEDIMPVSATRGGLDASGASALARISVMISMPFSGPFKAPEPLPDDEMFLPYLEMGLSDADVLLMDDDVLRSDSNEGSKKKG